MRDPEQTPDRRPLVYGVFAVAILLVAAFLFMPPSEEEPADLVLTPESMRQNAAVEESLNGATLGSDSDPLAAHDVESADTIEKLAENDGPATETHIDGTSTTLPATPPAVTRPKTTPAPTPDPVAPVRTPAREIEQASLTQPGSSGEWVLNVGAYSTSQNAQRQVEQLGRVGIAAHVRSTSQSDGTALYRVRVGYFATSSAAKSYGEWLKRSQNLDSWAGKR